MIYLKRISLTMFFICFSTSLILPVNLTLNIPQIIESPNSHQFYHELLVSALEENGHTVTLIEESLPWQRIQVYMKNGDLSISWMVESQQRNSDFIPIDVNITNGLIGKRILFIKRGTQHLYNRVKNLEDYRSFGLTTGMGDGWFDTEVWKSNGLLFGEQKGNWKSIYKMVENDRVYNNFSRGLTEILDESKYYPGLDIEQNLVFIYERDFQYYLSKNDKLGNDQYRDIIEESLFKAKNSGLIDRMVDKYWGDHFKMLNYDERVKIHLKTPN